MRRLLVLVVMMAAAVGACFPIPGLGEVQPTPSERDAGAAVVPDAAVPDAADAAMGT